MERLGQVTFDWVNGRIKLRQSWETAHKALGRTTPLARARVARQEEGFEIATINTDMDARVFVRLPPAGKESLVCLMRDYSLLFARHHKRSRRSQLN